MASTGGVKAIILIGGPCEGARFRPISLSTPKPLIMIGMDSMISFHVGRCASVSGMVEIICMGYYDSLVLESAMTDMRLKYNLPVHYFQEPEGYGTCGGLRHFSDRIMQGSPDLILLVHGDIWCDYKLDSIIDFHRRKASMATLLGVSSNRQSIRRAQSQYGCLVTDASTQLVKHWVEKPESFHFSCINGGIYVFLPSVIDRIVTIGNDIVERRMRQTKSISDILNEAPKERLRLEEDILIPLTKDRCVFAFPFSAFWGPLKGANQVIRGLPNILSWNLPRHQPTVVIHPSATVHPTACIGPAVSIGENVVIGEGVRLSYCIIQKGTIIRSHSLVRDAIVEENCLIGYWCRITGESNETATLPEDDSISLIGNSVEIESEISVENSVILTHKIITRNVQQTVVL